MTLPKQTAVGEITAAKIIPALLALRPAGHEAGKKETTGEKRIAEGKEVIR